MIRSVYICFCSLVFIEKLGILSDGDAHLNMMGFLLKKRKCSRYERCIKMLGFLVQGLIHLNFFCCELKKLITEK